MKSRIMEIDNYIKAIFDNEVLEISVSLKDQQKHFSKIMWFSINNRSWNANTALQHSGYEK